MCPHRAIQKLGLQSRACHFPFHCGIHAISRLIHIEERKQPQPSSDHLPSSLSASPCAGLLLKLGLLLRRSAARDAVARHANRTKPGHSIRVHSAGSFAWRRKRSHVAAGASAFAGSDSCALPRLGGRAQLACCRARLFRTGCNHFSRSREARKARHTSAASKSRQVARHAVRRSCGTLPTRPVGTRGGAHGITLSNRRSCSSDFVSAHSSRWRASISERHGRHRYRRERRRRHNVPPPATQGSQRPGRVRPQT